MALFQCPMQTTGPLKGLRNHGITESRQRQQFSSWPASSALALRHSLNLHKGSLLAARAKLYFMSGTSKMHKGAGIRQDWNELAQSNKI